MRDGDSEREDVPATPVVKDVAMNRGTDSKSDAVKEDVQDEQ